MLKTKTIYLAVEINSKSDSDAITKTISVMKALYDEEVIKNYEVFTIDSRPLKETKPYITSILYEIMKVTNFSENVIEKLRPYIDFVKSMIK